MPEMRNVRGTGRAAVASRAPEVSEASYGAVLEKVRGLATRWLAGRRASTERVLIAGGMIAGIVAISYLIGVPQWMKQRKENRQWVVVNNLTPEHLLLRCGKPLTDETRDLYPVVARDIRYNSAPSGTVVLKFSRTAEEASDWVFMSMQDEVTGKPYETPIEKISALSCLDSRK